MTPRARIGAVVLAVVVVTGVAVWAFTRGGDDDAEPGTGAPARGPSELAVVAVRGTPNPLLAVVGTHPERPAAALVLPSGVTVVAPGQGETTIAGVAALPGESIRIATSNAIGAWADHYGVVPIDTIAAEVDELGGLSVALSEPATLDGTDLEAGEAELTGAQVVAYLSEPGEVAAQRWAEVLEALLAAEAFAPGMTEESDDAEAFADLLDAASGAAVEIPPVARVGETAAVLDQPPADDLVRELFGVRAPTPIVVQNGNGQPNVGEVVASHLLPEGFRVVLSQNADTFRHRQTEIAATAGEFADEAEQVRELLGVGRVVVSQVPSGLADITIVVGRDFTA